MRPAAMAVCNDNGDAYSPVQRLEAPDPNVAHEENAAVIGHDANETHGPGFLLPLGPNGALGSDSLQWRSGNPVSYVSSTKAILERCIREKGIELDEPGRGALADLPETFA